jgi:hypothetical protein
MGNNPILMMDPLGDKPIYGEGYKIIGYQFDDVIVESNKWSYDDDVRYYNQHPRELSSVDAFYAAGKGIAIGIINYSTFGLLDLKPKPTTVLKKIESDYAEGTSDAINIAGAITGIKGGKGVVKGGKALSVDNFRANNPKQIKQYEKGMAEGQAKYPDKSGKIEKHHVKPEYIFGKNKEPIDKVNAAYHQLITNEFRKEVPYGTGPLSAKDATKTLKKVYDQLPLPPKKGE